MINSTMEAFSFLVYPNFEEHHWLEISSIINVKEVATIKQDQGLFKLKLLFDAQVNTKKGDLEDIQNTASNQQKIKDAVEQAFKIKLQEEAMIF